MPKPGWKKRRDAVVLARIESYRIWRNQNLMGRMTQDEEATKAKAK